MNQPCEVCGASTIEWRIDDASVLRRCPECDHLTRCLPESLAHARDDEYGEGAGGTTRIELTYRRLKGAMPELRPGSRVLEVGCGPEATLAKRMVKGGLDVVGLDPNVDSEQLSDHLRLVHGGLGHEFDAELEAQHVGEFNAATAIHVLEHIPDLVDSLTSLRALLQDRAPLYAITPAGDSRLLKRFGSAWWMLEDPTHVRFFSATSLRLVLKRVGFSEVILRRPILDSMSTDAATLIRYRRPRRRPLGVLDQTSTKAITLATLPASLAWRGARPRWRPVLEVVAR